MGKQSKSQKRNAATDMAKNLGPTSAAPVNDSDPRGPTPVVSKKPSNSSSVCVRRSGRLQSIVRPAQSQEVEEIDLVESEKEEDEPHVEQPLLESEPCNGDSHNEHTPDQKTLDDRLDDIVRAVEEHKSKGANGHASCENTSVNFNYKSLYFNSQKKIEALTSENHELARKLEIALGKLEVHENIDKSTGTVIISKLEKIIEAVISLTSHGGKFSSPGGGAAVVGGGAVPRKSSAKKRRHDQMSN